MSRILFDIETNGLLDQLDRVHSLVIMDLDSHQITSCADQAGYTPIHVGLDMLAEADQVAGHNIMKFDLPALRKVYPDWDTNARVIDTLVLSRLIWPEIGVKDAEQRRKGVTNLPPKLTGSHGLKAWGFRLGFHKGDFAEGTDWSEWSPEMQEYCVQDVRVNEKLLSAARQQKPSKRSVNLEHDFQYVIHEMEKTGFPFDIEAASKLYADMVGRRDSIDARLKEIFRPWWLPVGQHTPKRSMKRFVLNENGKPHYRNKQWVTGWYEQIEVDCPITKVAYTEFDPGSGMLIADRLIRVEGWRPTSFTSVPWAYGPYDYKPSTAEDDLAKIDCESARLIVQRAMLSKRIGQIAEGDNAWLKLENGGRIYGTVITNGAVTGRCTHRKPNMAQIPSGKSEYGHECRSLFHAPKDMKLIGVDADGLELVGLAHYMAYYDDGAFAVTVSTGSKEDGTDPHTQNQKAAGLETRDQAKTFIYAFLYGAGDWKIGHIVAPQLGDKAKKQKGKALKNEFLRRIPALARVVKSVADRVETRGSLIGLDGRVLPVRSTHSALNTLIQSSGAVLMKEATVLFWNNASDAGYVPGKDFALVAHVHDEFQIAARPDIAEDIGRIGKESIEKAGENLGLRCPVTGSYDIGDNWAETH